MPLPSPLLSSQAMIVDFASSTSMPFREISALAELIAGPVPV